MKRYTDYEKAEIAAALVDELEWLERVGAPLSEGFIGAEALSEDGGYAYAAKGGYGNMGVYLPVVEVLYLPNFFEKRMEERVASLCARLLRGSK